LLYLLGGGGVVKACCAVYDEKEVSECFQYLDLYRNEHSTSLTGFICPDFVVLGKGVQVFEIG